jgi:hypothetical protein
MTFTDVLSYIQNSDLDHSDLERITEAVKWRRSQNARRAANTLTPGQMVQFNGRRGRVVGVLESIKIKNATVKDGSTRWRVPLSMLEAV